MINDDREVFIKDGIEFIREGKNIFFNNTRTQEEQQEYVRNLKEGLPRAFGVIKNMIAEVVALINAYDKIYVMGAVAAVITQKKQVDPNDDEASEIFLEYCQSIALATPNVNKGKIPEQAELHKMYYLLLDIRKNIADYYATEHLLEKHPKIDYDMRSAMIRESVFVRGNGYTKHLEELYGELFQPHDEFFVKHYGFSSGDIVQTFKQVESSFTLRVATPDGDPHPFLNISYQRWRQKPLGKKNHMKHFAEAHPGAVFKNGHLALYRINDIAVYDTLFKVYHFNDVQEKVVKALSLSFGQNQGFADYEPFHMLNQSEIVTRPFVDTGDGQYYLFNFNTGARNSFNIAQNLIKQADEKYYNEYFLGSKHFVCKDRLIERKVLSLFRQMLPAVIFTPNTKYQFVQDALDLKCARAADGMYELDIVGVSPLATYIIEVKAGLINEESKRGAIKSIKTNLKEVVGEAVCQSYRAYRFVTDKEGSFFTSSEGSKIVPLNREKVFRISVSFSYLGSLLAALLKLREFGVIDKNAEFAWTVNVFDLVAFSQIITSEEEFIDYLSKRIPMYDDKRLSQVDEMDMLGLYFEEDLQIDPVFKDSGRVILNAYKDDFDDYFEGAGPKPVKKRNNH